MADAAVSAERKSWQVPRWSSQQDQLYRTTVHTFASQQLKDGRAFLEASPGHTELEESIRILSGQPTADLAVKQRAKYSKVRTARAKRNLREMVNALSDIRFAPGYHADNSQLQDTAMTLNKYSAYWYADTFADLKIKRAIQWMAITPCGWLELAYREIPGKRGKRTIDLIPHSWFDVVQTGITESGDHQESYTVTIINDWPVYYAHSKWPDAADRGLLRPDRETPRGWLEKMKDTAAEVVNSVFSPDLPTKSTAKNPTCRLYYQYVLDLSVNRGKSELKMGYVRQEVPDPDAPGKMVKREVQTPWSYTVPYVGQPIKIGVDRGQDGQPVPRYRFAEPKDCRIFPGRRLIVFTETDLIYDDCMFDWHGQVPLVRFSADDWPFGSFSMLHDVVPIDEAINEIDRIVHQTVRNRFNPTMLYNLKALTQGKAKALRTDVQGQRVGYNGTEATGENVAKPLLPSNFNTIEDWIEKFRSYLMSEEDREMGVNDISNLAKLKIGGNPDSLEKALEIVGPITKGIARDMERQMRDLAEMWKWLVFQYETTPRLLQVMGVDGLAAENFDFEPGNLIPSHLPGEDRATPSPTPARERARWVADHCPFLVVPNTLHDFITAQMKLTYLQLSRQGFPISPYTLADVFRIPNFAKVPEGADTEVEKWKAWQRDQLEFKASLSKEAQQLAEEQGLGGDAQGGGGGNAPNMGPKGGFKGTGGRAPSGQRSPQVQQKGDGRTIVRESP